MLLKLSSWSIICSRRLAAEFWREAQLTLSTLQTLKSWCQSAPMECKSGYSVVSGNVEGVADGLRQGGWASN